MYKILKPTYRTFLKYYYELMITIGLVGFYFFFSIGYSIGVNKLLWLKEKEGRERK